MKLFLLFLVILVYGCGQSTGSEAGKLGSIQEINPLRVGDEWTYKYIVSPTDPGGYTPEYLTIRVVGTQLFRGRSMYQMSQDAGKSLWYYDGTTDLYSITDTNSTFVSHLLHSPLTIGQSFVFRDTVLETSTIDKAILTLTETSVPITTEAGTFSCFHFIQENYKGDITHPDSSKTDQWYAKGIGMIRNRYSEWHDGKKADHGGLDLKSYKIN